MIWAIRLAAVFVIWCLPHIALADQWDALDDATLERLATDLQAGRDAQGLVETLKATLSQKDGEIAALREALERGKAESKARDEALLKAEEREKLRAESVQLLKDALAEYKDALKEAREENKAIRKQAAIDRLVGVIPLLGLALMFFGFGAF